MKIPRKFKKYHKNDIKRYLCIYENCSYSHRNQDLKLLCLCRIKNLLSKKIESYLKMNNEISFYEDDLTFTKKQYYRLISFRIDQIYLSYTGLEESLVVRICFCANDHYGSIKHVYGSLEIGIKCPFKTFSFVEDNKTQQTRNFETCFKYYV